MDGESHQSNPLDPAETLKAPSLVTSLPPADPESAITKAEKAERQGGYEADDKDSSRPAKRIKLEGGQGGVEIPPIQLSNRVKGVAPIKAEYLIKASGSSRDAALAATNGSVDGGAIKRDARDLREANETGDRPKREKNRGQNTSRTFGSSRDEKGLCSSRATHPEFSPAECRFAADCRFEHDLRKYLDTHKRADLQTFGGKCPVWEQKGFCEVGWKCRFVGSHMKEVQRKDGRRELVLSEDESRLAKGEKSDSNGAQEKDVTNIVSTADKISLTKKKLPTPKADAYLQWLDKMGQTQTKLSNMPRSAKNNDGGDAKAQTEELRAQFTDPPHLPSEKRCLYFGPETPVLAPLTTQGNLPFRRLCVSLGAQVTYSEMAMSLPLMQGQKSEWALMKAHESELSPPAYRSQTTVASYDHSKDLKFGAQICASKPYQALKATELLTKLCPHLRVIDFNCGCPIDLVYRQGAGSALLDNQSKLEKILRGMNVVSGEIPISVKIRMGTKDSKPTAEKLINRLVYGNHLDDSDRSSSLGGPCGVAAITLHGRSRQQRYTKSADWSYIAECAALIKAHNAKGDELADTIHEPDERHLPASASGSAVAYPHKTYFIGNGDCFSHTDYFSAIQESGVSAVMLARGALIKPWLFEEIASGQYLDKSASERLGYVEKFARFGLETWGSDERGVGTTRRFLLEWLSFASRYVPVGILEHLPPKLQDRPPAWRGRNELETLLGSENYRDWIKISEMFLGPATKDFTFQPKHKSNNYDYEAEG